MILDAFIFAGRHGRVCLVAGLLAGLMLPGFAAVLRPWLPEFVAALLFVTALRIGPRAAIGNLRDLRLSLVLVAVFQVMLPLAALGVFAALGLAAAPMAVALVLMLSAPSVTGSPNFTILLGHDPAPALRLLILGTALLPVTVIPVLWLTPGLGDIATTTQAALRLLAVIAGAVSLGFGLRHLLRREIAVRERMALDGLAAVGLAVIVIGLMSALSPALRSDPAGVALWLAAAVAANFGLQLGCLAVLGGRPWAVPVSIIAGNRNIALFLVALPAATDPLLIFIGCYQVPMYLTPILMHGVYRRSAGPV